MVVVMLVMVVMIMIMIVMVVMVVDMMAEFVMGMAFMGGAAKQPAHFVGREIRDYVVARLEFVCYALDIVGFHYAQHHFFVDGKRHIHLRAFHDGGPVLVADRMAEFHRDAYDVVGQSGREGAHVDDKDIAEVEAHYGRPAVLGIVIYDVAVSHATSALKSYGIFVVMVAFGEETAFLSRPLVEEHIFHMEVGETLRPLGRMYVPVYFCDDFHRNRLRDTLNIVFYKADTAVSVRHGRVCRLSCIS